MQLADTQDCNEFEALALPAAPSTVRFPVTAQGQTLMYDLKCVMRLRQPRSGALLTGMAQHQARAAFEHPFEHSIPTRSDADVTQEPRTDADSGPTQ